MARRSLLASVSESMTEERGLLLLFLAVAMYGFVESFSFNSASALFPRLTTVIMIVGCVLLLFEDHLPSPLQRVVSESGQLLADSVEDLETPETDEEPEPQTEEPTYDRPISGSLFTALLTGGFVTAGYLFGLLWVSPLTVFVYAVWFRQSWQVVLGLSVLAFLIVYAFMTGLNLPLDEGVLLVTGGIHAGY